MLELLVHAGADLPHFARAGNSHPTRLDLQRIVESIDQLAEVELPDDAESLTYFDSDVHREDRAVQGLSRESALLNAPETDGERFCVPQIVDKDEE